MVSLIKSILTSRSSRIGVRLITKGVSDQQTSLNEAVRKDLDDDDDDLPIQLEKNPFERERRVCILCKLNIEPDYKNVRLLSQFQSSFTGRIYDRHITGLCKHKQERIVHEIKKAQESGLMPTYHKNPHYLADPKLFDPDHPFKPSKYS